MFIKSDITKLGKYWEPGLIAKKVDELVEEHNKLVNFLLYRKDNMTTSQNKSKEAIMTSNKRREGDVRIAQKKDYYIVYYSQGESTQKHYTLESVVNAIRYYFDKAE